MTVYVDQSIFPFRGTLYCHVWADSIDELHIAAARVGLRRDWFQEPPKASWSHYDCAPRIRALLIRNGAVETDQFGPLDYLARLDIASGTPSRIERGNRKLELVNGAREHRKPPSNDLFEAG